MDGRYLLGRSLPHIQYTLTEYLQENYSVAKVILSNSLRLGDEIIFPLQSIELPSALNGKSNSKGSRV